MFLLINAFIQNYLGALGHIIHCYKGISEGNTAPLRLWKWFSSYRENPETRLMILDLEGELLPSLCPGLQIAQLAVYGHLRCCYGL